MKHIEDHFAKDAIATASAIVRVFETGSPLGDYSAVAILNDGAGVSYGASQFTHRSGSLVEVVERYLANGGAVGRGVFSAAIPALHRRTNSAITSLATDRKFKKALASAGITREMRDAQDAVAFERYMVPAIRACIGSGFRLPLSLAVIYDSMTHGSYNTIRDRVRGVDPANFEKAWITEYVRQRDAWLASILRLRSTRYRTRFFLDQIAIGRWELTLPLSVHGVLLTRELLRISPASVGETTAAGPTTPSITTTMNEPPTTANEPTIIPQARPPVWKTVESGITTAAERYDRVEHVTMAVAKRTDRAKSLWTTVGGTLWQTGWAVFGFMAGMPREVWLVVAIIAAVLTLAYLYRQNALGKIREMR